MNKKRNNSSIKNIGMGILDTLTSIDEEKSNDVKEEKNNTVDTPKSTTVLDEKSKRVNTERNKSVNTQNNNNIKEENNKSVKEENNKSVKEENNKGSKEKKSKRSFMLTEKSIQRLNMLNMALDNKDLSTIVDEAINLYFQKNKKEIEKLINMYDSLK